MVQLYGLFEKFCTLANILFDMNISIGKTIGLFLVVAIIITACDKSIPRNWQGGNLTYSYIYITEDSISPVYLNVATGSSIKFVNTSSLAHTMVADIDSTALRTITMQPSTSFVYKKDTVGLIPYHCIEHPTERGSINFRQ